MTAPPGRAAPLLPLAAMGFGSSGVGDDRASRSSVRHSTLALIESMVHEAACPASVLIHAPVPDFVTEASKRATFAYIANADPKNWQVRQTCRCL